MLVPELDAETELGTQPERERELEPDVEAALEPETEAEAETEPETELGPELWAAVVLEPSEVVLEPELEPGSVLEPEPEAAPEPELEPHAEFVSEVELEHEPEEELVPHSEFFAVAELEPEAEFETETELESARSHGPVHARMRKTDGNARRSPVFMATAAIACIFISVVSVAAIVHSLHTTGPSVTTPPSTTLPAASSPATARVQSATDSVDSATTAAVASLASLPGFPTPTNVANVINPYISSLQLYDAFLSGASVPQPARSVADATESQVRHDVAVFSTIDGLPPIRLGAYLNTFSAEVTRLQASFTTLEQDLRSQATT